MQIYNSIDPLQQKVIEQQKPLKFKLLCSGAKDAGDTAQWQSTCFTCMRPSVQYPVPHKEKTSSILCFAKQNFQNTVKRKQNYVLAVILGFP